MNAPSQPNLADASSQGLDVLIPKIDRSCRLPLLLLFASAAVWLILSSVFALVSSIKFHSPAFLADHAWLTYGRVRPAYYDSLIYGFCLQAGLGLMVWLIARLGRVELFGAVLVTVGAALWNLGVTIGILGILAGNGTGFEMMDLPGDAAVLLFIGWLLIGISTVLTLHYRAERRLHPSIWFLLAALFWFPWIFSTANLLLLSYPIRGVAQSVISWWYSQNLLEVCLRMFGIAAAFYFVPRDAGRPLHSRYLALLAFWTLILCTGWGGIPNTSPVPAWMPAVSATATVMDLILILAVALNVYQTLGRVSILVPKNPAGSFILVGVACFIIAGLMRIAEVLPDQSQLSFSWFAPAQWLLQTYGFFALVIFGAAYQILPRIAGSALPWPALVRAHFWTAVAGVILSAAPLAIGGILQAAQLRNPDVPFIAIMKSSAHFLRVSTIGDLLLLIGNALFFVNAAGLLRVVYQSRVLPAYGAATADLFKPAEGNA